jgi:hypothetical protein
MRWALCSGTDVQGNNSQQVSTGVTEMKDGLNRTLKMEGANISSRGERDSTHIFPAIAPLPVSLCGLEESTPEVWVCFASRYKGWKNLDTT